MTTSSSSKEDASEAKTCIYNPEDVLNKIGTHNKRLMVAIVSCGFSWGFGALSIMSSAFTSIDCGNCTDTMLTVTSEFDLRGEMAYLSEWSTSFFMIGNMIGGSTLTHAADRYGRRPIMILCLLIQALSALLASQCTSVHFFASCRLLQGAAYTGVSLVAWVAAYENTPTKLRWFTTFFFGATWVLGYCAVAFIVYLSTTWRQLMIATSFSTLIYTFWCWKFVPETLHYLVSKHKSKNIHKWLKEFEYAADQKDAEILICNFTDDSSPQSHTFFKDIWRHKIFIAYCIIQLYLWTCDNFIYFGLSLYSTHLAGSAYANYLLLGLVELPAYIVGPILLTMLGRRFVVAGTHFLAALCFLVPMFADADSWLSLCCWVLGKFAISCSFMSLFVYASEVFPTPIRNGCVGLCSVLSRSGAIAAPYIKLLGSIWVLWPMILLAALSFAATVLTCFLPETKRKPLPSSMVEATPCSTDVSK